MRIEIRKFFMGLAIPLTTLCQQGRAQTNETSEPAASPPVLLRKFELELDKTVKTTSTGMRMEPCGFDTPLKILWNTDSTHLAIGASNISCDVGSDTHWLVGFVQIYDVTDPKKPELLLTLTDAATRYENIAYNHDSNQLAVAGNDYAVRIYDGMNSYKLLHTLDAAADELQSLDYNHDGSRLAVGSADGRVRIYDAVNSYTLLDTLNYKVGEIRRVAYNPDGSQLVVLGCDKAKIYDGEYPRLPLYTLTDEAEWDIAENILADSDSPEMVEKKPRLYRRQCPTKANHVSFSHDGSRLAMLYGRKVLIYNATNPAGGYRDIPPKNSVEIAESVTYNHDSSQLAVGYLPPDKVRIYDSLNPTSPLYHLTNTGFSAGPIAYSHNSSLMAVTRLYNPTIQIYHLGAGATDAK